MMDDLFLLLLFLTGLNFALLLLLGIANAAKAVVRFFFNRR